jgi:two-component system OmpR family response regulator
LPALSSKQAREPPSPPSRGAAIHRPQDSAFLQSPQQILSREQLLAASRIHDEEVFDRSIDVQILRPRRKLEVDPSEPKLTERGALFAASIGVL